LLETPIAISQASVVCSLHKPAASGSWHNDKVRYRNTYEHSSLIFMYAQRKKSGRAQESTKNISNRRAVAWVTCVTPIRSVAWCLQAFCQPANFSQRETWADPGYTWQGVVLTSTTQPVFRNVARAHIRQSRADTGSALSKPAKTQGPGDHRKTHVLYKGNFTVAKGCENVTNRSLAQAGTSIAFRWLLRVIGLHTAANTISSNVTGDNTQPLLAMLWRPACLTPWVTTKPALKERPKISARSCNPETTRTTLDGVSVQTQQ